MSGRELPRRRQNRLSELDYSAPGAYFITICTRQRQKIFWDDVGAVIDRPWEERLSSCGRVVLQAVQQIPLRYPALSVEKAVVMPDHVHLLLQIKAEESGRAMPLPTVAPTDWRALTHPLIGALPRKHLALSAAGGASVLSPTVSTVVQQMKGAVSKHAGFPVWQKGFYDHVVRSEQDFREVWKYIEENPLKPD